MCVNAPYNPDEPCIGPAPEASALSGRFLGIPRLISLVKAGDW